MLKVLKYNWRFGWNAVKFPMAAAAAMSVLLGILSSLLGGTPVVSSQAILMIVGDGTMDTVMMIASLVWFGLMLALLVLTVVTFLRNLDTRMFGPEAYLTHTLPVHTWQLLMGKAMGTWLFGVFMTAVAFSSVVLIFFTTAVSSGTLTNLFLELMELLPKLGDYHFQSLATGLGYVVYALAAFLAWSFLTVVQLQFLCIASRQFGRFHVAGSVVIFWLLASVENNLNRVLSMGFLVFLLAAIACFFGSCWLLKKRLSI